MTDKVFSYLAEREMALEKRAAEAETELHRTNNAYAALLREKATAEQEVARLRADVARLNGEMRNGEFRPTWLAFDRLNDENDKLRARADSAEQEVARLRLRAEVERLLPTPPTPPDALAEAEREAAEACEALAREAVECGSEVPERPWRLRSFESFDRCYRAIRALDAARATASADGAREALVAEVLRAMGWHTFSAAAEDTRKLAAKGFLSRPGGAP
jgi:chromosome segregation ATPase